MHRCAPRNLLPSVQSFGGASLQRSNSQLIQLHLAGHELHPCTGRQRVHAQSPQHAAVQGRAKVCKGAQRGARRRGLQGRAKVCKDAWGQVMVCNGVQGVARVCEGVQGCMGAGNGVQWCAGGCKGV